MFRARSWLLHLSVPIILSVMLFSFAVYAETFPPEGSNIAEQAELQAALDNNIALLDAPEWEKRKDAADRLVRLLGENKHTLRYFFLKAVRNRNPEIRFSAREIVLQYFKKYIYKPGQGNGFLGIQLGGVISVTVKKKLYHPIQIILPVQGFPGQKAGLMPGDLILAVDGIQCSEEFNLDSFIAYIAIKHPGEKVTLTLLSDGRVVKKTVTLAKRPQAQAEGIASNEMILFREWYKFIKMRMESVSSLDSDN